MEPRLTGAELLDYLHRPILVRHPNRTAYSVRRRPNGTRSLQGVLAGLPIIYEVRGPYGAAADHAYLWFGSEEVFLPLLSAPDDPPSTEVAAAAQDAFDTFLAWQQETEEY